MPSEAIVYTPQFYVDFPVPQVGTAWNGLERILYDIVNRFEIPQHKALEFGVQFGYSTAALAHVFAEVSGVDTFKGDEHAGYTEDHFRQTAERLREWPNITLFQTRYQNWIVADKSRYDLIHIDIVHTYEDTYLCGRWAAEHSRVVIFHDTESFYEVKCAVRDLAVDTKRTFYNYEPCHGLGILV